MFTIKLITAQGVHLFEAVRVKVDDRDLVTDGARYVRMYRPDSGDSWWCTVKVSLVKESDQEGFWTGHTAIVENSAGQTTEIIRAPENG